MALQLLISPNTSKTVLCLQRRQTRQITFCIRTRGVEDIGNSRGEGYVIQQEFPVGEPVVKQDFQGRGELEVEISKEGGIKKTKKLENMGLRTLEYPGQGGKKRNFQRRGALN